VTIRKGAEWGEATTHPPDALELTSDAALATAIERHETRPLLVRGGDLHRSLGSPRGAAARRLPIDVIRVITDDVDRIAVAHVVARRRGPSGWWRGPIVCVMNGDHLGPWDVAPRAHLNDGRFDIVEVSPAMSLRHRWQARRRLPTGTHVPHPDISTRQAVEQSLELGEQLGVWVDSVWCGSAQSMSVAIEPDAAEILA
jgi:hypothetical protein